MPWCVVSRFGRSLAPQHVPHGQKGGVWRRILKGTPEKSEKWSPISLFAEFSYRNWISYLHWKNQTTIAHWQNSLKKGLFTILQSFVSPFFGNTSQVWCTSVRGRLVIKNQSATDLSGGDWAVRLDLPYLFFTHIEKKKWLYLSEFFKLSLVGLWLGDEEEWPKRYSCLESIVGFFGISGKHQNCSIFWHQN